MSYESSLYNKSGIANPVEFAVIGHTEDSIVNDVWEHLKHHIPKNHGLGIVYYKNRKQYIKEKLEMFMDEFMCDITYEDVVYICTKCWSEDTINKACRAIFERCYPD